MTRKHLFQGRQIAYTRTGSGPAVLLLHGFGETAGVWDFQKESLSQHFQILIPQLPGTGQSETLPQTSIETLADGVQSILTAENITAATVIGHSMGGYIALAFAQRHPQQLTALGLFHSTAYADSVAKMALRRKGIAFVREVGAAAFLQASIPNLFSPATKQNHPALVQQHIEATKDLPAQTLIAHYEAMLARPDRTAVLSAAPCPVLFVLGETDTAVPLADGLAQSYLPDEAHIYILKHSGHMGMLEEPQRSTNCIHRFLTASHTS